MRAGGDGRAAGRPLSLPDRALARVQGAVLEALTGLPAPMVRGLAGRPVVAGGQRLEPTVQLMLKLLRLTPRRRLDSMSAAAGRRQVALDIAGAQGPRPPVGFVEPVTITGAEQPLRGRLYAPVAADGGAGLLVYFHGGGFVVCDLDTHDHACRLLAHASGVRVLSVEYRLAPEHPFPAAVEDAWAVFRFAVEHAAALGTDPARVAVGGDSAGGGLAAGVAQRAAADGGALPALQMLLYAWLDLSRKRFSRLEFGEGFYLTDRDLDWWASQYVPDEADRADPRCSPLLADHLDGVAPAYIATAGFDPLRDEGEEYAERLRAAGVPVVLRRHPGLIHGFANTLGAGRASREALVEAAGALRLALALAPGFAGRSR